MPGQAVDEALVNQAFFHVLAGEEEAATDQQG
jgi:hypothetical protein